MSMWTQFIDYWLKLDWNNAFSLPTNKANSITPWQFSMVRELKTDDLFSQTEQSMDALPLLRSYGATQEKPLLLLPNQVLTFGRLSENDNNNNNTRMIFLDDKRCSRQHAQVILHESKIAATLRSVSSSICSKIFGFWIINHSSLKVVWMII